jgi:hypothetical protein
MDASQPDEKMEYHPPSHKTPSQYLPTVDQETSDTETYTETYPEGGLDAWLVVLGAWCGLTASIGIYNTAGVLEVIVSKVLLPDESPSNIGWIFSIYAFVTWLFGVQVGPTFDAMGPRALLIAGTVCTLVGVFALSVCTSMVFLYYLFLSWLLTTVKNRILPDLSVLLHPHRYRLIPHLYTLDGLRGSLVPESSRPRQRRRIYRSRVWRRRFPADDTKPSAPSRLGLVHPDFGICIARSVHHQRGVLPQQDPTAQRVADHLARYVARP